VEFLGWYETAQSLFIAMEYFEYGDLQKHIIGTGPCSENDAKMIAYQLLEGLGVMHEMGFAHRDLKPQVGISPMMYSRDFN
jgi:serine/threonine protein kinase